MSTYKLSKAQRTVIYVGDIPVLVFMMPDGSYRASDTSAAEAIDESDYSFRDFRRSKLVKTLQGMGFAIRKPDKLAVEGSNKPINASCLEDVSSYWAYHSSSNPKAHALVVACTTETLERRCNAAFDQHVTEEEYNLRLAERIERLTARHQWCDVVKQKMIEAGYYDDKERVTEEFRRLTKIVNKVLFGVEHFNCNRDNMTFEQQKVITMFETLLTHKAMLQPELNHFELVGGCLKLFANRL